MADARDTVAAAAPSPAERVSLLAPLRARNFRNLWLGGGISLIGDQFKFVALSWLVLSLTGRSAALGTVLMLQAIPRSILMLAGGVVTDRVPPRTVMLLSDAFRALVVGAIAGLAWTERITMAHLYALALLFGTVHFFPAQASIVPDLVPPGALRQANAIQQLTSQVVLAGAPALAGGVIAAIGVAGGFAVNAVSFLVSAVFLFLIRPPARGGGSPGRLWAQFVEGLRYVRQDPVTTMVVVIAALLFFGFSGATYVGLPVLAKGPLGTGPAGLGMLFSASGAGALLGGIVGGMRAVSRRGLVGSAALVAMGVLLAGVAAARTLPVAAVLLAGSGALMSWLGITFMTMLQLRTDRAYMGRVMAIMLFGIYGLYPFSYGLAGWVSDVLDGGKVVGGRAEALADMMRRWPHAEYRFDPQATAPYAARIFDPAAWSAETPLRIVLIGTDFEVRVWETLLRIPVGRATTYGAVASRIGKPSASRAVGMAVGKNPISFVVPCHRVIGKSGALTGYHWGLTRKRAILGWEAGQIATG